MSNGLRLNALLAEIPGIRPMAIPAWVTEHSFHLYIFRVDAEAFGISRDELLAALQGEGIPCSGGYPQPLYRNPMFLENNFHSNGLPLTPPGRLIDYSRDQERCPCAEQACKDSIWIEHRVLLAPAEEVEDVARAIQKIYECRHEFSSAVAR
jgi:dTDP-4-amino-4,6-dideoxygalactose transaminase